MFIFSSPHVEEEHPAGRRRRRPQDRPDHRPKMLLLRHPTRRAGSPPPPHLPALPASPPDHQRLLPARLRRPPRESALRAQDGALRPAGQHVRGEGEGQGGGDPGGPARREAGRGPKGYGRVHNGEEARPARQNDLQQEGQRAASTGQRGFKCSTEATVRISAKAPLRKEIAESTKDF